MRRHVRVWAVGLSVWAVLCATPLALAAPCKPHASGTAWSTPGPHLGHGAYPARTEDIDTPHLLRPWATSPWTALDHQLGKYGLDKHAATVGGRSWATSTSGLKLGRTRRGKGEAQFLRDAQAQASFFLVETAAACYFYDHLRPWTQEACIACKTESAARFFESLRWWMVLFICANYAHGVTAFTRYYTTSLCMPAGLYSTITPVVAVAANFFSNVSRICLD